MRLIRRVPAAMRIFIALVAGIALGLALPSPGTAAWADILTTSFAIIGEMWLAALQMTILPLIFALLATSLSRSAGAVGSGMLTWRTMKVIFVIYAIAVVVSVIEVQALLTLLPVDPAQAAAMRTADPIADDAEALDVIAMFTGIVPTNIFAAAAEGAMLPVVVFALLFGAALIRIAEDRRNALSLSISGLGDVMFVIVGWIMALAPLGVLGLILPTVREHGAELLLGLAAYLRFVIIIAILTWLLAYPVALYAMRGRFHRFVRGAIPSMAVAFGSQSSLATLPVMLRNARAMGVPEQVAGTSLPLCVTMFRVSAPAGNLAVAAYGAAVYGTNPTVLALFLGAALSVAIEFGLVGLPNQVNLFASNGPICVILGVPIEFLAVIIAVDTLPDTFYTAANVSMDLAATTVVASSVGFDDLPAPI